VLRGAREIRGVFGAMRGVAWPAGSEAVPAGAPRGSEARGGCAREGCTGFVAEV